MLSGAGLGLPIIDAFAADSLPSGTIKILVGTAAGGPPDTNSRSMAEALTQKWKQAFVVENKVGANGTLAFQAVQSAPPDGRTWGYFSEYNLYAMPLMGRDALLDGFEFVTPGFSSPSIVVVGESSPYTSLAQVINAALKAPERLTFGSGGLGSPAHIAMARLTNMTKSTMTHVPYKGGGEQAQALIGGQVDIGVVLFGAVKGLIASKRLKPLAVTTSERLAVLPQVPTVNEAIGSSSFEVNTWGGYVLPKGTPKGVVDAVFSAIKGVISSPPVLQTALANGSFPMPATSPAAFAKFVAEERTSALQLLKELGLVK
jgi:tripartite-type tricarboxylate transporter receptor subunit TctC